MGVAARGGEGGQGGGRRGRGEEGVRNEGWGREGGGGWRAAVGQGADSFAGRW